MDAPLASRLALAGYTDPPTWSFGPVCRVWVTALNGGLAVVMPGTRPDNPADDIADLTVGPLAIEPGKPAHEGFFRVGQMAFPHIARLALQGPVDLIAHSLGAGAMGAIATMAVTAGIPIRSVWGFGTPRTAIGSWQRDLLFAAGIPVFLFRNGGDVVTRLPIHLASGGLPAPLRHLATSILPGIGDWETYGAEIQIGDGSRALNIADHAMAAYVAALATFDQAGACAPGTVPA